MQLKISHLLIMIFLISLQTPSLTMPVFDLDLSASAVTGPIEYITTYRNNLITFDGLRWRIDDSLILTKTHFDINSKVIDEWDFNNYEEVNGQLIWAYKKNGLIDTRSYSVNKKYLSIVRFFYNENKTIDEEIRFDSNGALVEKIKYQYNTDGKLTTITVRDTTGATTKLINYSFSKAGTKSCEETIWYGKDSARLVRLYDNKENIYEATGYKADKIIYHNFYRTDSSGVITAMSRNFDGESTRFDISYTYDIFGNWTRKIVKIYLTRNGFTFPGESYMDTRSISYRQFAAYPSG